MVVNLIVQTNLRRLSRWNFKLKRQFCHQLILANQVKLRRKKREDLIEKSVERRRIVHTLCYQKATYSMISAFKA